MTNPWSLGKTPREFVGSHWAVVSSQAGKLAGGSGIPLGALCIFTKRGSVKLASQIHAVPYWAAGIPYGRHCAYVGNPRLLDPLPENVFQIALPKLSSRWLL